MVRQGTRTATAPAAPAGFVPFYRSAIDPLYSYLANRCSSVAEVEDLVQECFAAVIVATDNGTAEAMSMPWLMRVARNKLIDHYRREKVRRIRLPLLRGDLVDEVTLWHGEASREAARESLAALAPDHRAVLVLRHLDGLSVPEIAQLIGKSIHATESVLARARVAFKREFVEVTRD